MTAVAAPDFASEVFADPWDFSNADDLLLDNGGPAMSLQNYEHVCALVFDGRRNGNAVRQRQVFAVFRAPLPMADPAAVAVDCAVAGQRNAATLESPLVKQGLPPVPFGIGVHAGSVIAAHVGPEARRQYVVVGEAVNLGSRLCGAAASGEVAVSEAAGDCLVDAPYVRGDALTLKGVPEPVGAFRADGTATFGENA